MNEPHPPPPAPLRQNDYDAIESAVMETEKGRWFLAEFARRHRAADTAAVLAAISGLERILLRERRPDLDRIRLDVGEMKDAIDRTKAEIAHMKQDGDGSSFERATSELDQIVVQTETATSDILTAAEKLQEVAFAMREGGIEAEICDAVETLVMTIYTACSFQDLTGQRTQKVVQVLRFLEQRINSMVEIWGIDGDAAAATPGPAEVRPDAHLLNGPALAGEGMDQSGIDDLMGEIVVVEPFEVEWSDEEQAAPEVAVAAEPGAAATALAPDDPVSVAVDEAAALAEASEAMQDAIGTLREVSGAVARKPAQAAGPDPLDRLSLVERQALFS